MIALVVGGALFAGGLPARDHAVLLAAAGASGAAALLALGGIPFARRGAARHRSPIQD